MDCGVTCPRVFEKLLLSVVNTLAPTFLIVSSSFFHVTRTAMRSRMSSKFGKIQAWTEELTALERLKKSSLTYNGKDVNALAPSFLIGSSSFLQVTRTSIRAQMSLKFSNTGPYTGSYLPQSILKMAFKCCDHSSTYMFYRISFIFSCYKDSHKIWDEFEIQRAILYM